MLRAQAAAAPSLPRPAPRSPCATLRRPSPPLQEPPSRFLLAKDTDGQLVAFAHFHFTLQGELIEQMAGEPTLLVDDLYVAPAAQRKGVGRHMMQLLELIGRKQNMSHLMVALPHDLPSAPFFTAKLKGLVPNDAWRVPAATAAAA